MKFGAKFSKPDVRDYKVKMVASATVLPESYECPDMPDALDQGNVSSCVAHALALIVEWHSRRQGDSASRMSTAFIYGNRMNSVYSGEGMVTRDAIDAVTKCGTCEKNDLPRNIEVPEAIEYFKENYFKLCDKAYPNRFTAYAGLGSDDSVKAALIKYGPVVMAMNWYNDIWLDKFNVMHTTQERKNISGAHCMVIYGYNKDGWLVQNSWGKNWGNDGRCIIPYDIVIREKFQVIDEYSENERKKRIAELENSNNELRKQISALNERIRTLNESLDGFDYYKKLTDDQKKQIAELTECLKEANEKTAELMETIERQQKELETLKNELIEIKKPFSSPVGRFFAKIINAILSVLNYIFNKK